jgi:hypothetical protein
LDKLRTTCELINKEAGVVILYEQMFLAPGNTLCSYEFFRDGVEYMMVLTVEPVGPSMLFIARDPAPQTQRRKGYQTLLDRYVFRRTSGRNGLRIAVDPEAVTESDFQQWFAYLLSGFQKSFRPLSGRAKVSSVGSDSH